MAQTFTVNKNNEILPIEWEPYVGEEIIVNTIIRGGKRIHEKEFFEDKVKAVPRGNAYCIGNGPSRKGFDLNKLKPTGGVICAISTTTTKKIPNQIMSKPACLIIGSIIAIVNTTAEMPSRNIPKIM